MPIAEVAEIVTAVASALDYAHKRSLLNRGSRESSVTVSRDLIHRRGETPAE
jgi:serine/threonine-protein kinase